MQNNPLTKSRKSNRLKNYDYSKNGYYFVTICVQNRLCLFGDILDGEMILNDAGEMIKKWWFKLSEKFENIICDKGFVVMPNHIHGIVIIENDKTVGTDPRVCPNNEYIKDKHMMGAGDIMDTGDKHMGLSLRRQNNTDLSKTIQWFKTMTTNEYINGVKNKKWNIFDKKLWQRSFYDHIIRDTKSLENIKNYIFENPLQWANDDYNLNKI